MIEFFVDTRVNKDTKGILNRSAQFVQSYGSDLQNLLQRSLVIAAIPFKVQYDHDVRCLFLTQNRTILTWLKNGCNVI